MNAGLEIGSPKCNLKIKDKYTDYSFCIHEHMHREVRGEVDTPWSPSGGTLGMSENQTPPAGGRQIEIEKRIIGKYPQIYTTPFVPTPHGDTSWGSERVHVCFRNTSEDSLPPTSPVTIRSLGSLSMPMEVMQ